MKHSPRHAAPRTPVVPRLRALLRRLRKPAVFVVTLVLGVTLFPQQASAASIAAKQWWVAPVVGASCSSPFGQVRSDGLNGGTYTHQGRDLLRYWKAPVRAAANGTVIAAGYGGGYRGGYGYRVILRHGKGQITTLYGHLAVIKVHVGQWVRMGTTIGLMGSSGWSYATHTHFEVRSWGTPINPDRFMAARGVRLC